MHTYYIYDVTNLCVLHKDRTFDTLKTPLHGTIGRYKPASTRHGGATLGSLANGSANATVGGSHETVLRNNLDELVDSVKNHYDAEDDVVL